MRHSILIVLAAALSACATAETAREPMPAPPRPAPSLVNSSSGTVASDRAIAEVQDASSVSSEPTAPAVVGWVAGTPLTLEDLVLEWHSIDGREVFLVLEKVVTKRLALAEAERYGVRLIPERVEMRVAEETARVKREIAQRGLDVSVDDFLRGRFGVEPKTYFGRMRLAVIHQLIVERAVRRWTLSNDWMRVRMILVDSQVELDAVQSELTAGMDFASVAKARSLDDSAQDGGLIPFLVHEGASPLAAAAFAAAPGEIAGPIEVSDHFVLLHVEERHAPLEGEWDSAGEIVESSIQAHPVEDAEFLYWKLTMEERYPIDVTSLKELLGIGE